MKQWLRENGLTLAFSVLLLGALVGQAFTGEAAYNEAARLGAALAAPWPAASG